jgi:hypothetical protein
MKTKEGEGNVKRKIEGIVFTDVEARKTIQGDVNNQKEM